MAVKISVSGKKSLKKPKTPGQAPKKRESAKKVQEEQVELVVEETPAPKMVEKVEPPKKKKSTGRGRPPASKPRINDGDLSEVIARFQQKYGDEVYRDFKTTLDIPVISTGSIVVDKVIGIGGIPRGRFVEFCGWESTGKTTLALQTMQCAVRDGLKCAFLDFEQSMTPSLAVSMGIDFNKSNCVLFQPPTFEAGEEIIDELVKREFGLIIIDSIPAMVPAALQEVAAGKTPPVGLHARMVGSLFKRLISVIHKTQTTILCINHVRQDIKSGSNWGPPTITTPGGATARYLYSVRLYLQVVSKVKASVDENDPVFRDGQVPVYNIVRVTGEKNKVGIPYLQGEFALVYGKGVDNAFTILDVGKKSGLIQQAGSWYSYEDSEDPSFSFRVQGENAAREYLNSNPELLMRLADKLDLVHEKSKPSLWIPGHANQQAVEHGTLPSMTAVVDLEEV